MLLPVAIIVTELMAVQENAEIQGARARRWAARTDLVWLCNEVLDFTDVSRELNGVMISRLQQFPKPRSMEEAVAHDMFLGKGGGWSYTPLLLDERRLPAKLPDPKKLPGKRRVLILDSRGHLKTTIDILAHTIQWILNYPDISIIIFQSNEAKAVKFLGAIKEHFQSNEKLRSLFPELCPPQGIEWGNQLQFTVNRTPGVISMWPTVSALTLGGKTAGIHVEVMKFSDVVEHENSKTEDGRLGIISAFDTARRLLQSSNYWIDVEGTRYHFADLYGEIIKREMDAQRLFKAYRVGDTVYASLEEAASKVTDSRDIHVMSKHYMPQEDKRTYNVYINSCWDRGKWASTYDYDDYDKGYIEETYNDKKILVPVHRGPDGFPIGRWPEKHDVRMLLNEQRDNPDEFARQMLNYPLGGTDGVIEFPITGGWPVLISRKNFRQNVRVAYYDIAVDTADTVGKRSDYTAMTVAAFDSSGRCYITEIVHGKIPKEQIIEHLFALNAKYKPQRILLEREKMVDGLMVAIQMVMDKRGIYLPIERIKKLSSMNKKKQISDTLRVPYIEGNLRFLDDLGLPYRHLLDELHRHPSWHDDILDTLKDLLTGKVWYGRLSSRPDPSSPALINHSKDRHLINEMFERAIGISFDKEDAPSERSISPYYSITGGF